MSDDLLHPGRRHADLSWSCWSLQICGIPEQQIEHLSVSQVYSLHEAAGETELQQYLFVARH